MIGSEVYVADGKALAYYHCGWGNPRGERETSSGSSR